MRTSLVLLAAAACGGGGSSDVVPDGGPDGGSGDKDLLGQVIVRDVRARSLVWPPTGAAVEAWFSADGRFAWHTETAAAGDCRLLEFEPGFCDGTCDGVCRAPDVCEPWPTYQPAGTLTVEGGADDLTVTPTASGEYLLYLGFADGFFGEGDRLTMSFAGAEVTMFEADGTGPAAIAAADPMEGEVTLELPWEGDFVFEWDDPSPGASMRARLIAGGNAHGQPNPFVIDCEAPDTGSITVPGELLSQVGAIGFGGAKGRDRSAFEVTRYLSTDVELTGGRVQAVVGRTFVYGAQRIQ